MLKPSFTCCSLIEKKNKIVHITLVLSSYHGTWNTSTLTTKSWSNYVKDGKHYDWI